MFRKDLIPLLLERHWSVAEIARAMRVSRREAEADLRHLFKSLRHLAYRVRVEPARCRKCGFEFSLETLGKPSKCPQCRGTWVSEPRIRLTEGP